MYILWAPVLMVVDDKEMFEVRKGRAFLSLLFRGDVRQRQAKSMTLFFCRVGRRIEQSRLPSPINKRGERRTYSRW